MRRLMCCVALSFVVIGTSLCRRADLIECGGSCHVIFEFLFAAAEIG